MNTSIILANLQTKYPHQPLFIQTATEILDSLDEYLTAQEATDADYRRLERLLTPERIIAFRVTWENDQGELQYNLGYRVQFSSALGPYKGGLRFDPTVNEDVLKFLGLEQIFKNALTGLPLGAGKGGADFDPRGKSEAEIRRFCRAFMIELHRHIGSETDVPAGDIGVGANEIAYLYGMYKQIANNNASVLTGKGVHFGGACGRIEATGYGLVYFAAEMLRTKNEQLSGKTAVVSGSGNVATYAAYKLIEEEVVVKTLSDRHGYILKESGLSKEDVAHIEREKAARKALSEIEVVDSEYHEGKPWQAVATQLYFPCATQNEITKSDAEAIVAHGAMLVAEGANMPSDLEAIAVFEAADSMFGPAKAANAGGVAVSGLEMAQNAAKLPWKPQHIDDRLREIMTHIHTTCARYGTRADGSIDYIKGANIGGFVQVFKVMKDLGW